MAAATRPPAAPGRPCARTQTAGLAEWRSGYGL